MTDLPHPFLNKPETIEIPKDRIDDVDEIYRWIKQQPNFPNYTKNHAYLFYHACVWDMNVTKKALQRYCQIRGQSPDLFDNRDPLHEHIQSVFNMTQMVALPKTTEEKYHILVYRLTNTDPSHMHFGSAIKAFCMFNDIQICVNGIAEGYVVVFDMKGLRFGHLARIQVGAVRAFMNYIQDAHPARLKKIYVVNTSFFIHQIMAILKPLIRGELMSLLQFVSGPPSDVFPVELLPEDYNGTLDTMENFYKQQRTEMETIYRDWLIDTNNFKEIPLDSRNGKDNKMNNNNLKKSNESALIESVNKIAIN